MEGQTGTAVELELKPGDIVCMTTIGGADGKTVTHEFGVVTEGPAHEGDGADILTLSDDDPLYAERPRLFLSALGKEQSVLDRYRLYQVVARAGYAAPHLKRLAESLERVSTSSRRRNRSNRG